MGTVLENVKIIKPDNNLYCPANFPDSCVFLVCRLPALQNCIIMMTSCQAEPSLKIRLRLDLSLYKIYVIDDRICLIKPQEGNRALCRLIALTPGFYSHQKYFSNLVLRNIFE